MPISCSFGTPRSLLSDVAEISRNFSVLLFSFQNSTSTCSPLQSLPSWLEALDLLKLLHMRQPKCRTSTLAFANAAGSIPSNLQQDAGTIYCLRQAAEEGKQGIFFPRGSSVAAAGSPVAHLASRQVGLVGWTTRTDTLSARVFVRSSYPSARLALTFCHLKQLQTSFVAC